MRIPKSVMDEAQRTMRDTELETVIVRVTMIRTDAGYLLDTTPHYRVVNYFGIPAIDRACAEIVWRGEA
jgi:hypothetical protein